MDLCYRVKNNNDDDILTFTVIHSNHNDNGVPAAFPCLGLVPPQARRTILDTSMRLISQWRAAHHPQQPDTPAGTTNGAAANGAANGAAHGGSGPLAADEDQKAKRTPSRISAGVAPGSFLGLMLDARDRTSGEGLTDIQVRPGCWLGGHVRVGVHSGRVPPAA